MSWLDLECSDFSELSFSSDIVSVPFGPWGSEPWLTEKESGDESPHSKVTQSSFHQCRIPADLLELRLRR